MMSPAGLTCLTTRLSRVRTSRLAKPQAQQHLHVHSRAWRRRKCCKDLFDSQSTPFSQCHSRAAARREHDEISRSNVLSTGVRSRNKSSKKDAQSNTSFATGHPTDDRSRLTELPPGTITMKKTSGSYVLKKCSYRAAQPHLLLRFGRS